MTGLSSWTRFLSRPDRGQAAPLLFAGVRRGRQLTLLLAGALALGILLLRLVVADPDVEITVLYAIPISLLAAEFGLRAGLAATALAVLSSGLWEALLADHQGSASRDAGELAIRLALFGAIAAAVGTLADRLRQSAAERARFWELSNELLAIAGFDGHFKQLNAAWQDALGWTPSELSSKPFVEFVHPDDRERTEAEAARLGDAAVTVNFENRYRCKDGGYRTLLWSARGVPADGVIYAFARDVTERNEALAALKDSEQFLNSVLEQLPTMVFVKDAKELRFIRFNRAGQELLGYSREDLIGKSDLDLFPAEQAEFFIAKDRDVLKSGESVEIAEEAVQTRSGEQRYLHTKKTPIIDADGTPRYLIGISEDITDRRLAQLELAEAKEEAERANLAKSEFLSRMSHELRTPQNAITGFGQLLEMEQLEERDRESVGHIVRAGRHLLELINEVLDISRIESGTMSISLEPIHTGSVLADVLSMIRPLAEEARVSLKADPGKVSIYALADQQRLKQALINLLSNAVKYNRAGGSVEVICERVPPGGVRITVADSGHGMDEDQLAAMFTPFERLGAEGTGIEGTGLGLALSKRLVEAMGGTLVAESEPGRGTTMRVELGDAEDPAADPTPERRTSRIARATTDGSRARFTVLHIEDNPSNLALIEQALARVADVRLISAMHGRLGIEMAREHHPDLILLDLHLPDLSGAEILVRLKSDPATADSPVTIVSADATNGQVERLRAAGAAGYITKPIDVEQLLDLVSAARRRRSSAPEQS